MFYPVFEELGFFGHWQILHEISLRAIYFSSKLELSSGILGRVKVYYAQLVRPYPRSGFLGGVWGEPPWQGTIICENQLGKTIINFLGGCRFP